MSTKQKVHNTAHWQALVEQGKHAGRLKDIHGSALKFQEAYDVSRSFPENDPRRGESAYYLAYARFVEQQPTIAIALFEEALQYMLADKALAQRCSQIHSILAAIYFGLSQLDEAERHSRASMTIERELSQESWENIQMLASVLMIQKNYGEAVPWLQKLIKIYQEKAPAEVAKTMQILAYAQHELGNAKEEIRWKKEILRAHEPRSIEKIELPENMPEGWGLDRITHFFEASRQNEVASFVNQKESFEQLVSINERFWSTRRNLTLHMLGVIAKKHHGKPFHKVKLDPEDWLELYFFMRAHSSFLGAARLTLSAQIPESYMLLRGAIENAQYAFYVSGDEKLKQIWLNRHKDHAARQDVRAKFGPTKIGKALEAKDSKLAERVSRLYDQTIDRGAHPNVKTFLANALQRNEKGEITLSVAYLNPSDVEETIKITIEVGKTVLDIFGATFPDLVD
jgi:tetratricopeptide (TPR) repeat protein